MVMSYKCDRCGCKVCYSSTTLSIENRRTRKSLRLDLCDGCTEVLYAKLNYPKRA